MNDKLESLVRLYKNNSITDYVLEREIANYLGERKSVQIVTSKNNNVSFCVFAIPEKFVEGFHITYLIDDHAIKNIYSDEEFCFVIENLKKHDDKILMKYHDYLKDVEEREVPFSYAMGFLLSLYSSYRGDLLVRDGNYLPEDDEILKLADKFSTETAGMEDTEELIIKGYINSDIIKYANKYKKSAFNPNEPMIKIVNIDKDAPLYNFHYQHLADNCTSTYGARKSIPLDPDTISDSNQ